MQWQHEDRIPQTIRSLDRKAGQFLERITWGYFTPAYSAETQEQLAIARISRSAKRRNRQIAENIVTTYEQVIQELNYLNFLDEHYPNLTPAEKAALQQRKQELIAILRHSTANANASL